jgi:hypothetical protein
MAWGDRFRLLVNIVAGFLNVVYKDVWDDLGFVNNALAWVYYQDQSYWHKRSAEVIPTNSFIFYPCVFIRASTAQASALRYKSIHQSFKIGNRGSQWVRWQMREWKKLHLK